MTSRKLAPLGCECCVWLLLPFVLLGLPFYFAVTSIDHCLYERRWPRDPEPLNPFRRFDGKVTTTRRRPVTPTGLRVWEPTPVETDPVETGPFETGSFFRRKKSSVKTSCAKAYDQYQSPLFTKLPTEVRLQIWEQLLGDRTFVLQGHLARLSKRRWQKVVGWTHALPQHPIDPTVLRTCRRIYTEAIEYLYARNTFEMNGSVVEDFTRYFPQHRISESMRLKALLVLPDRDQYNLRGTVNLVDSIRSLLRFPRVQITIQLLSFHSEIQHVSNRYILDDFERQERALLADIAAGWQSNLGPAAIGELTVVTCWKLSREVRGLEWPFRLVEDPKSSSLLVPNVLSVRDGELIYAKSFGQAQLDLAMAEPNGITS